MKQEMIWFAFGVRNKISSLLPHTWYIAGYRMKGEKIIVTRISRAYYEEVENPGVNRVAFRTGNRIYGRSVSTREVREEIGKAFVKRI